MHASPVALVPEKANAQHYELPPAFFDRVLGPHGKYSCAWFDAGVSSLEAAEARMLELTCARAGLEDGMHVLDLGCGWGSLSLWIARHYPACRVLAVSNSKLQRDHVRAAAARHGLGRVEVRTADANVFDPAEAGPFDRVLSVEMFEHMRNWPVLFRRVRRALTPEGRFFLHVFCHHAVPYLFEDEGPGDWMARHFFSGGIMPSFGLPGRFPEDLRVESRWWVDGRHYARTAEAWLANLDRARPQVLEILRPHHGDEAGRALRRWRLFFLAVAELFGHRDGAEWGVGHYRMAPVGASR
ncbi:MAG: cyclopropane-fatty-acyl-phospholipid synthase family protein [Myxococcota bacterium]|nr:cyclopropane-fatty-acyl-phospholipid synthase family protein [Myxococcota bacterium]